MIREKQDEGAVDAIRKKQVGNKGREGSGVRGWGLGREGREQQGKGALDAMPYGRSRSCEVR